MCNLLSLTHGQVPRPHQDQSLSSKVEKTKPLNLGIENRGGGGSPGNLLLIHGCKIYNLPTICYILHPGNRRRFPIAYIEFGFR